jgi:hypothetical protein
VLASGIRVKHLHDLQVGKVGKRRALPMHLTRDFEVTIVNGTLKIDVSGRRTALPTFLNLQIHTTLLVWPLANTFSVDTFSLIGYPRALPWAVTREHLRC